MKKNLKKILESTKILPQYMKDIYLNKISEKKFSKSWEKRLIRIIEDFNVKLKQNHN